MKKRLLIILGILIAVVLICVVVINVVLIHISNSNTQRHKDLMANGPWASEAIWVDTDKQFYLVCSKNNGDMFTNVKAYILVDDQWLSTQFNLNQGSTIVSLNTSDGKTLLTANAKLENDKLYLNDIETDMESIARQYSNIEMSKFSYQEQVGQLPFEIQ